LCATLARLKAEAVARRLDPVDRPTVVLGCDSLLEFDGESLGKPADADEAHARWRRMRGRSGILHTGHCLVSVADGRRAEAVASAEVHFVDVSDDEIAAYVGTGEPLHVAGAFTIDGLGGWFVDRIAGDPGTVVGVSLPTLRRLLRDLGVGVPALWSLH
jgi:septum formation protein